MIGETFYLNSEDLGEQWRPERLTVIGRKTAHPTGQTLFNVKFDVPPPEDVFGPDSGAREIYLGNTPGPSIVDIYVSSHADGNTVVPVEKLSKLGTGTIHKKGEEKS